VLQFINSERTLTRQTGLEHAFDEGVTFNGSVEVPGRFFGKAGKHVV